MIGSSSHWLLHRVDVVVGGQAACSSLTVEKESAVHANATMRGTLETLKDQHSKAQATAVTLCQQLHQDEERLATLQVGDPLWVVL
jgi:hypothetical protein